jgi:hypothetical protein
MVFGGDVMDTEQTHKFKAKLVDHGWVFDGKTPQGTVYVSPAHIFRCVIGDDGVSWQIASYYTHMEGEVAVIEGAMEHARLLKKRGE